MDRGLSKQYSPGEFERGWYDFWLSGGYFHSEPDDREPYTVVIPPPNVTGILHMGHMLNNTLQDVLVRRARMQGRNACWVPGTDHASIATEAKVVSHLHDQGIEKSELSREAFMEHAWAWTRKHGGIILDQLKRLGASCDWDRTAFTMDDVRSGSVIRCFVDLYRRGFIYRGVRMVNWDPQACTALSDEEVIHREVDGELYYLRYMVEDGDGEYVVVATTRPETIMGDVAVCVNPGDERYKRLVGRRAIVPLVNRSVPVIADDYVDLEFGTGVLKITPAHDINDYEIGLRHHLDTIDIFDDHGVLTDAAGLYVGQDRDAVRVAIVKDLDEAGLLERREAYRHSVGFSERTDVAIEPKLSQQWFLRMDELSAPALEAVECGAVRLVPDRFVGMYRHWLENVRDWCISRQLWWGHRIPVWYYGSGGEYVVAESEAEALRLAREAIGDAGLELSDLRQDEDVLDTWFSSWLWPLSVFNGVLEPENREIKYYYPTNDLVTAPEIIFFWVARMIIAGYAYRDERPFGTVYLTGIVRDGQRRKMSKSLGNSPDPIGLMDRYGADGVRVGMLLCSSAGNDLLFDEGLCEQGRNFCNKVWNALRLVLGWPVSEGGGLSEGESSAVRLFESYLSGRVLEVESLMEQYRISDALMELYRLFTDEFSGWYLEMVKPEYGGSVSRVLLNETVRLFDALMWYLHPFIPFLTEEVWHDLGFGGRAGKSIMVEPRAVWLSDSLSESETDGEREYERLKAIVSGVRAVRATYKLASSEELCFSHRGELGLGAGSLYLLKRLCGVSGVERVDSGPGGSASFLVDRLECFVVLPSSVDLGAELARIEEELEYHRGFLRQVEKKLRNESFVARAPESVVRLERKKHADALARISALEDQLAGLR